MMYPYCSIIIKFISKTKFEKVYLWNSLFFFVNHRDELTGRCINETKKLFLDKRVHFLCFIDILEEIRNKLPEFGDHRTECGGACMVRAQDLRKNMFFTWNMNKSVFDIFLLEWGHGVPSLVIFNLPLKFGSKQSTLKFWVFGLRA